MSEMVERVAKAICIKELGIPGAKEAVETNSRSYTSHTHAQGVENDP